MKNIVFFILFLPQLLFAQNKFTISGTVTDAQTGEGMIGAIVNVPELKGVGTSTNAYGFYSLTLPQGEYTVQVHTLVYKIISSKVTLDQNISMNASLEEEATEMQEVVITGEKNDENVTKAQMGVVKLDMKDVSKIPVIFGEKDIIKMIQLMPGIKTAGEGNTGFYVRGGGADQNLVLLDEAPVYNASHLLGFFSVFNSDAIKDVTVYKGGMPAQYGGRLSSVLDIKMNDGNSKKYGVSGGIGLISSKLNIEGPIVKDKGSFIVSGRRTYADAFLKLSSDPDLKNNKLYFYDLNMKANYKINEKNHVILSGYFGRDKLGFGSTFGIDWGNATGTVRWNRLITPKWFSNTMAIFSNYSYNIHINSNSNNFTITSRIRDYNFKQEFEHFASPRSKIKIGINAINHAITPGQITVTSGGINPVRLQNKHAWENAIYASHEWNTTEKLNITYGLRLSSFSLMGAGGDFFTYDADGNVVNTSTYNTGSVVKTYVVPEPRISASYKIGSTSSVKGAASRNAQYLHLISNSTTSTPTDLWIPTSQNVKPELATQFSLGYFRNFKDNMFEFSTEVYYKDMQNQIDYKNGANTRANDKIEGELLYGKGRAYGVEFFLKKKYGKFNGWIGYTLSKTERQIEGISSNNWYRARQDRPHDISVVAIYDISKKWTLSSTFVFYTGNAVTFPSGKYMVDGEVQFLYTERNGYRMPNYHRLDIGATWQRKKTEKFESSWSFSVYNVYARENAYTITFQQDPNDASKTQAVQTSLFRIVPSVSYNFKF